MKYPQLVSPRAVNAISDWLVSRLEQLGVESPQIYTRLLLSLLQSSVQVNDPIEFSNLEAFFANRKGGHKRFHLPSDTETLKKLNAVQCLREIVSNEQETATIEQLVNELCEKLKDIEKQTQDINDEERYLIETNLDSLPQTSNNSQQQQTQPNSSNHQPPQNSRHHHHNQQQQIYNNSHIHPVNSDFRRHACETDCLNDIDNDPKKRYFRAFPALSKEMEDSFRIWRRNAKSLTWPVVGRSIVVDNCSNNKTNTSSISSSSASSSVSDKIVEKKLKSGGDNLEYKLSAAAVDISGSSVGGGAIGSSDVQQQAAVVAASVKKKSKRRRNQALCKGKTIQNIRKLSVGTTSNSVGGGNKYHHYTHHRNSSPAWDTDFKGCWEMGPDLIKEFLSRKNGNKKRNRSNSDSMYHEEHNERKILNEIMPVEEDDKPIMKRYIDMSFCCDDDDSNHHHHFAEVGVDYVDEDYDDNTLASVTELVTDNVNPKRLYQREGHLQNSSAAFNVFIEDVDGDTTLDESTDSVDQLDFQQFKAKFNSNVEALWKDVEPAAIGNNNPTSFSLVGGVGEEDSSKVNALGISSAFYATTSLNALAPFKRDLWNFWSNYNQQNYDQLSKLSTTASSSSMITTRLDDSSASSGAGADIANTSDYFSMPSNLDDFDKSVGGVRRSTNEAGASLGAHTPSINVFLQNSIWSTSGDCVDAIGTSAAAVAGDTDKSFLFKVWHSNKKLSQLDVGNNSGEKMPTFVANIEGCTDLTKSKESSSVNTATTGANLQFTSYQNLKWSEGINAGPPYNSLRSIATAPNEMETLATNATNSATATSDNTNFTPFSAAAHLTGATWEAPAYGQNAQPDLKSWCASNPVSLTEMYGNDVCDSIVNPPAVEEQEQNQSDIALGPTVTLPNHCANTSGFVAYARIKQCGIIQPQTQPLQSSANVSRLPKDFFRYSEEENLLTSELTHFRPIEHFVDGHTFDISDALDTVEFERSDSGLMRYDSEEYLEYTRSDIYMADEEVATSTNLLKFGKASNEVKDEVFVIKFRVKRSGEIACQTEEQDFQLAAAKMSELPMTTAPPCATANMPNMEIPTMFSNTFAVSRQANNEAIMAAVTKAVAAAAKAAAENRLNAGHFTWLPPSSTASTTSTSLDNPNSVWIPDVSICDEVDFCKIHTLNPHPAATSCAAGSSQLAQNWSMQEVEKQCYQRRCLPQQEIKTKFPSSVDIERNDENSLDNSLHTLWGMCAVCNSCEYGKSMPANSLLRDELQLEADEIMSDLRYMQDLYIGESDILTEITETDTDTEDYEEDKEKCKSSGGSEMLIKNPPSKEIVEQHQDPMQVSMFQKVNQLIEDLLKPEKSAKLPRQAEEYEDHFKEQQFTNVWNNVEKAKNLWEFNEQQQQDNNIWQHNTVKDSLVTQIDEKDSSSAIMKPMKLLKQVGGGSFQEDTQYVDKLNWEPKYAKFWQQQCNNISSTYSTSSTSSNKQLEECLMQSTENDNVINLIKVENKQQDDDEAEEECDGQKIMVQEKNIKNLQSPPSTAINTYKRVQQFLNTSAAKIKLAANRKRRHSASQNFYQHQQNLLNNNNNNNNDNITDLNSYKQHLQDSIQNTKEEQSPLPNSNINLEEQPTKQTIITCKYWTTSTNGTQSSMDSAATAMMLLAAATNAHNANSNMTAADHHFDQQEDVMLEENTFGNTFSCLIDKNASILKHVTMMTRPLTR